MPRRGHVLTVAVAAAALFAGVPTAPASADLTVTTPRPTAPAGIEHSAQQRDLVNRQRLADDLERLRPARDRGTISPADARVLDNAEQVADYLDVAALTVDPRTDADPPVQLYVYEPDAFDGDGRVAIALGDLDTATHIAISVPGFLSDVGGMTPVRTMAVYHEARLWTDEPVAVLDWMAYDPPSFGNPADRRDVAAVIDVDAAQAGGQQLAADVAALRDADPTPAHITVLGNSYGSTTASFAAAEHGLAVDELVLTGSPGAGPADDVEEFPTGADHTWVATASHDFVTQLGTTGAVDPSGVVAAVLPRVELLGRDPAEDRFGAQRITAEHIGRTGGNFVVTWDDVFAGRWQDTVMGTTINNVNLDDHGHYYDPGTESLRNIGAIITGHLDEVTSAAPRYDPLFEIDWDGWNSSVDMGMQDPELDRDPVVYPVDATRP